MAGEKLTSLVVGMGEVGKSLFTVLAGHYDIWAIDLDPKLSFTDEAPETFDVMHICIRYDESFEKACKAYVEKYKPTYINVCTTAPVGTTEAVFGPVAVHSTTRGLHPNLSEGLRKIPKHVGGGLSTFFKSYFELAGIQCVTHQKSKTTELLHILNNCHYGINLMFANEAAELCREYGVDYADWMRYGQTNNEGYIALGHPSKVRPVLTPPGEKIGGHCVTMSAGLIPQQKRTDMIFNLAKYNDRD